MAIRNRLGRIKSFFGSRPECECVYLFGSVGQGRESRFSDLDLAVILNERVSPSRYTDYRIKVIPALEKTVEQEVDLVVFNEAPPFLKYQILRKGRRIYERKNRRSRALEARGLLEYFDFEPIQKRFHQKLIERLKKRSYG